MPEPAHDQAIAERPQASAQRSLRRRFVIAISLLVALVLVALTGGLALYASARIRAQIETRADTFAALAAGPASVAYRTYFASGLTKFRQLLRELGRLNDDLVSLTIFDTEGHALYYANDLDADGRPGDDPGVEDRVRMLEAVRGLTPDRWRESGPLGARYIYVAPHIEAWGRHRYSVVFTFSYDRLRATLLQASAQVLPLALLALGLGVGCAFLLAAQILRPLERLRAGARQLGDGDLQHRIALDTGDELQELAVTLDRMADRLSTTVDDLASSNARLNRLNRDLQELDRLKSDLLASVSHELRTPLTAISGYSEALDQGLLGSLDDDQRQALKVMQRNVVRLQTMIDQLLGYSRLERGLFTIERRPFDLAAVARGAAEALAAIHGPSLDLRLSLPDELPPVDGDPDRIAQVLDNLLTNAVKFSPPGSRIDLAARALGDTVEIEVADHGIGIPEDEQEQIFERFYQIDGGSTRKFGGMGLGLAIVREILALHHSEIVLDSRPGAGTRFRFALPAAAAAAAAAP